MGGISRKRTTSAIHYSPVVFWTTVCVLKGCPRLWVTEPYMETGENRVNMDLSWPLKARKATGQCVLDYYWSLATNCPSKYTATGTRPDLQLKTATKWTEYRLHLQHVQYHNVLQGSWIPDLDYIFFIKCLETEEATAVILKEECFTFLSPKFVYIVLH